MLTSNWAFFSIHTLRFLHLSFSLNNLVEKFYFSVIGGGNFPLLYYFPNFNVVENTNEKVNFLQSLKAHWSESIWLVCEAIKWKLNLELLAKYREKKWENSSSDNLIFAVCANIFWLYVFLWMKFMQTKIFSWCRRVLA